MTGAVLDRETILEWLRPIEDPEIQMSLVELGLVYDIRIDGSRVDVDMTLTSPSCPAAPYILDQIRKRLLEHEGVKEAAVKIVWEPKWDPKTMASEEAKEALGLW